MKNNSNDPFFDLFQSLAPVAVLFFIVGIIAFAVFIAYVIRLWLTQTAIFQIQEDLRDVKSHLLRTASDEVQLQASQAGAYTADEEKKVLVEKNIKDLKPRRAFVLLGIAIPILIVALVIVQNMN